MKKTIGGKEAKELAARIDQLFSIPISKKDRLELEENMLLVNSRPLFIMVDELIFPTLKSLLEGNLLKKITVDMGAVKFIVSGADIMRPGITKIDEGIKKGDIVSIIDIMHSKPIAVGISLFSKEEMEKMATGKAVKNLHHIGDKFWSSSM